jgi:CRP-like cAMP-binding protein
MNPSFSWLTIEGLFVALGHASFAITFLAYAQRNIIKLRMLAIASLIAGLTYNGWVHYRMPEGQDLWPVLLWLGIFLVQNVYMAGSAVRDQLEVPLTPRSRALMAAAVPDMHSRDWSRLAKLARVERFEEGATLIDIGDSTDRISILAAGQLLMTRPDRDQPLFRHPGEMWGELTYFMGADAFGQSPCRLQVHSPCAEVWSWSYREIASFCKSDRARAALFAGFVRAAGLQHGSVAPLINAVSEDSVDTRNRHPLVPRIHAECFAGLGQREMARVADDIRFETCTEGRLSMVDEIVMLAQGEVRVQRSDRQHLVLRTGALFGEVGFFSPAGPRERVTLHVSEGSTIARLPYAAMRRLAAENPALFSKLTHALASHMAQKLVQPLEADATYLLERA